MQADGVPRACRVSVRLASGRQPTTTVCGEPHESRARQSCVPTPGIPRCVFGSRHVPRVDRPGTRPVRARVSRLAGQPPVQSLGACHRGRKLAGVRARDRLRKAKGGSKRRRRTARSGRGGRNACCRAKSGSGVRGISESWGGRWRRSARLARAWSRPGGCCRGAGATGGSVAGVVGAGRVVPGRSGEWLLHLSKAEAIPRTSYRGHRTLAVSQSRATSQNKRSVATA